MKDDTVEPGTRPRFLSESDCHDIAQRLARFSRGGGATGVTIRSEWTGNVRWARNQIITSGDVRNTHIKVQRDLRGAENFDVTVNDISDEALVAAARRAERLAKLRPEKFRWDLITRATLEPESATPQLFSEATYQLDAEHRAATAIALAQSAAEAGVLSAGYIEVSALSLAVIDSLGHARYVPWTQASYSVTVRDPQGSGSGWAGVDWSDWSRIDGPRLSAIALEKCLKSRHPVAIEPGRYTTILEPQAVCDFVGKLTSPVWYGQVEPLDRDNNERHKTYTFGKTDPVLLTNTPGTSQIGEKVIDERITISADPMDPDLGFPPFSPSIWVGDPLGVFNQNVYHPTTWIKEGVLVNLEYDRQYGISQLGLDAGRPNEGAMRMSGGGTSLDEMVGTTPRGLLVTRFDRVQGLNVQSLLLRGYTRDGLWLIEHGKISKPVKNMMFVESILFALNNVEQLGPPQRTFHPKGRWEDLPRPMFVPPLKIRDFSFTALADAI